jgi:hypothetical protein
MSGVRLETGVVRSRAPYALARAVAATAVGVTGAAAAHTWAGGDVPTGPGLVLVGAVVLAGSLLVFRRDVPAWALLPLVAAAQLGVHESFGLVAAHDHGAAVTSADPGWTWQMVLAHVFVTLLTAVAWWAGRRAASYAVSVRERPALTVATRLPRRPDDVPERRSRVHLLVSPRRGPPPMVLPT